MLQQAAITALRIVTFRAGPQDLPYSKALTQIVVPLAVLADFLQYRLTLSAGAALLHAVISVAVLAGFVYVLLQSRGLVARVQQTANALFVTSAALTVAMLPPLQAITPHMLRIAQNPDLTPTEPVPAAPALLVMVFTLWGFLVAAHIFRHALNTTLGVGAAVALLAVLVTVPINSGLSALIGH